jgi:uncharacterized protein
MKALLLSVSFFLITLSLVAQEFPEQPNPPRLVNDYAKILSPQELSTLESKLVAYNDTTSTQIAIVIINSTKGYPIDQYAFELGEEWGVGQQGKGNGVMVLVAVDDRDIFIATGYGLEGALPDALVKRIIENDAKPAFRQNNYYEGLNAATANIILLAKGEYKGGAKKSKPLPWIIMLLLFLVFMLPFGIAMRNARQYSSLNGVSFLTAWMLLNQARRTHQGRYGGGGGFGGGSSGGFGGFGGGSFGGGGAGGSW